MQSPCIKINCKKCCENTNMLLSKYDIEKIQKLGYSYDYFVIEKDGWLQLKNKDRLCIFHNSKKCLIYKNRPEGCQLYPITYDSENQKPIYDKECPEPTKFIINEESTNKLFKLVSKIISERNQRIKK